MHLSQADHQVELEMLRRIKRFGNIDAMLEAAVIDSASPAICLHCNHTAEMEPDQDRGCCEACGGNAVVSALILADLI